MSAISIFLDMWKELSWPSLCTSLDSASWLSFFDNSFPDSRFSLATFAKALSDFPLGVTFLSPFSSKGPVEYPPDGWGPSPGEGTRRPTGYSMDPLRIIHLRPFFICEGCTTSVIFKWGGVIFFPLKKSGCSWWSSTGVRWEDVELMFRVVVRLLFARYFGHDFVTDKNNAPKMISWWLE